MKISVAHAVAEASTELAAFDACLLQAGIGNLNLLYLSSVIPNGASLVRQAVPMMGAGWGDRLYCVMAQARTSAIGHEVWAGLGWVQEADDGRGLFAEAMGSSESEVRLQLAGTLGDMTKAREAGWGDIETLVTGATCTGRPICALVVASYKVESWG